MKKLYLNIFWPGIIIGLLLPFSGKIASFKQAFTKEPVLTSPASTVSAPSAALLTENSESFCSELLLGPPAPEGMLRLPAFDPAKGTLTGVQVTTESTLIADIFRKNLRHNDYHALFSADLRGTLPTGQEFSHTAQLTYKAARTSDRQMLSGVEALVDKTIVQTEEVTASLNAFYGNGELDIPLQAINLIDLKAENFNYRTQLKAKICFDYHYESN